MKTWEWYLMVCISLALLIISFITKNIFIALFAFGIAMYIKKYTSSIPIPKIYLKFMKKDN